MHGTFRAVETTGRTHGKDIELRPLHPNAGITAAYRTKIDQLIDQMDRSVQYWVLVRYKNNEPVMAFDDAMPSSELIRTIRALAKRWQKAFDKAAWDLADYFTGAVHARTDATLRKILRDGGFSVKFRMTRGMRDVLNATRAQNVALIKSIPQQYLKNVEGAVMRSVQAGRDLGQLSSFLQDNYGVTKRRAAFIARSQNNLATAAINKTRQQELGLKAKWRHSGAGKHPRPTHVKAGKDRVIYDPARGWYDPAVKRYIWPGSEPGCKCVSISVIPGFS